MDLAAIYREQGRKQATEWLKGAIDAPNPYVLTATGARPYRSSGGLPESLDPYGGMIPLQGMFDEPA